MDKNHQDKLGSKLIATKRKRILARTQQKTSGTWKWGFSDKTGWDWLQLLIQILTALALPIALFLATQWFSVQQNQTSLQVSERQHQTDLQIAEDQQRETTLKTYLDNMSDLLLNHNLRNSKPGDEVGQVARERTLTTLRKLDASRNRLVLQFLQDADLIDLIRGKDAVITLSGADLGGVDLSGANLSYANLSYANLSRANLSRANLGETDILVVTNLNWANLSYANLSGANLLGANLSEANLTRTFLFFTDLPLANLGGADLRGANLYGAQLTLANLNGAYLDGADLRGANLDRADLTEADLSRANLKGAKGITSEELEKQTKLLKGATMPDGSIHP